MKRFRLIEHSPFGRLSQFTDFDSIAEAHDWIAEFVNFDDEHGNFRLFAIADDGMVTGPQLPLTKTPSDKRR